MSHIVVDLDFMNIDMLGCVSFFMKIFLPSFILQRKSEPVRRDDGLKCKVGPAEWVEHREMLLWKVSKGGTDMENALHSPTGRYSGERSWGEMRTNVFFFFFFFLSDSRLKKETLTSASLWQFIKDFKTHLF